MASRVLLRYQAADLTLEGAFLVGLIGGPYAGAIVGAAVAVPALVTGEFIALPFAVGCGFAGGGLRELCPKEAIWHFSPFVFSSLPRHVWRLFRRFRVDWHVILLLAPVMLELLRQVLGHRFGTGRLFYLAPTGPLTFGLILLATVLCVATPIKIWNNARIEHRLQEQETLLMAARLSALANQINPHFLFNTLTSISSLVRLQPETARMVIQRLSALLRRLMRSQDHFVPLREELLSIDDYLDIEVIRFGPQLRVQKDIDPATLDVLVPSMILQPLVENSIKHGLSRKVGGGRILIRTERRDRHGPHRDRGRRARDDARTVERGLSERDRAEQRQRAAARDLRRGPSPAAREHARQRHVGHPRDSRHHGGGGAGQCLSRFVHS